MICYYCANNLEVTEDKGSKVVLKCSNCEATVYAFAPEQPVEKVRVSGVPYKVSASDLK